MSKRRKAENAAPKSPGVARGGEMVTDHCHLEITAAGSDGASFSVAESVVRTNQTSKTSDRSVRPTQKGTAKQRYNVD